MNRAKPILRVLCALFAVLLLVAALSVAVAQKPTAKKKYDLKTFAAAIKSTNSHTRSAQQGLKHQYRGNMDVLPSWVTRRVWNRSGSRAPGDSGVVRQTVLLTRQDPAAQTSSVPAQAQDEHPFWTTDERYIYFDSNRVDATKAGSGPRPDGIFNIFRMFPDGSGVTQVTTGDDNKLDPSVSVDGNSLVYVSGGRVTLDANLNAATQGFNLYLLDLNSGNAPLALTSLNPSGFNFSDVRHPTWAPGGSVIAFSGQLGTGQPYHIFIVNRDTGVITQFTNGASNDYSPSWSPDGNLIAFTTNATGFTSAGPAVATGTRAVDNIWVINTSIFRLSPHQVTGTSTSTVSNRNPSWSTLRVDPLGLIPGETNPDGDAKNSRQLIAFSSNRDGSGNPSPHFDIYWMQAKITPDPNAKGSFTISTPESVGNPALKLQLTTPDAAIDPSDPSVSFDPSGNTDEDFPVWPQYISSYRLAFQSNRGGNLNLWAATLIDINAPTLLKYSLPANEIVHVARDSAPETSLREVTAGEVVRFRVRMADYESGVGSVWLRIKDPDSQPQSADGKEHKIYFPGIGALDNTTSVINPPYELDAQAINPNTYTFRQRGDPDDPTPAGVPSGWPAWNTYFASVDDANAFTGNLNPPDTSYWLPMQPVTIKNPDGSVKDFYYEAAWRTPADLPSDWYLDVIAYDNAVDPFNGGQSNWKIYDYVWGFTTKPFAARSQALYVNDYDPGQAFFLTRFGAGTQFLAYGIAPTESWMTEMDPALLPNAYVSGTTTGTLQNVLTPLGLNSYGSGPFYPDALCYEPTGPQGQFNPGSIPITGRYDQWRILSRGPVPDSVLNQYAARKETVTDPVSGLSTSVTVGERCVIWHSPYSGNLFVGPGTITDRNTQDRLAAFVANGGRLCVTGQDVAWALTLGGQGPNSFLTGTLLANYSSDFALSNQINMIRRNDASGRDGSSPISTQTWYLTPDTPTHNYPPIPTAAPFYEPPSAGAIYLGSIPGTVREYMCENQAFPDVITTAGSTTDATYALAPIANAPCMLWGFNSNGGRVVYLPFGMEGINPESFSPPMTMNIRHLKNRRVEIMHNILDYLRTGRIIGFVRSFNGSNPVAGTTVRAFNFRTGALIAVTTTQADGSYTLDGLDTVGIYVIDATRAGFYTLKTQGQIFHGGYQARVDMFLTEAQPGGIRGKVTRTGDNAPVAGANVTATDPVNGTVYSAVSQTDGTYIISNVAASTDVGYVVRITNITDLGYGSSIPPSYGGGEAGALPSVKVSSSTDTPGVDFQLKPLPGSIAGKVTDKATGQPIAGATVQAFLSTNTTSTPNFSAVTGTDGTYTIANVDPSSYLVFAAAPGYAASAELTVNVVSAKASLGVDFQLSAVLPGEISGLVTTDKGSAISGVTIRVYNAAGTVIKTATTGSSQTTTNTDGSSYTYNYKITSVPAGSTVTVTAQKNGYTPPGKNPNDETNPVSVTVPPGDKAKNINFTLNPLYSFDPTLSLVSAPYDYTVPVTQVLGVDQSLVSNGSFRFLHWDGSTYVSYPTPPSDTFHRGVGYFMEVRGQNASLDLTQAGNPIDRTQVFKIQLNPGWNMIGEPFDFPVNFLALKVQIGGINDTGGATVDMITAQSGSSPLLGGALWTYANGNYQIAYTLDPFRGYWIRAYQTVTLLVDPIARQDRSAKSLASRGPTVGNVKGDGWSLDLTAVSADVHSAPGRLGVNRSASNGYDRFKLEAPPAVGTQNITLTFDHSDWGDKSGKYSMDVRSATATTNSWDFTVASTMQNQPVTLAWAGIATVPGKQDLILTDLDTQAKISLRTRGSYVIPASKTALTRHFRLEARRATRQSLQLVDVRAQVNTSPGRATSSVGISYTLTADATVQVHILQNGHTVRTIETGRSRAAGSANNTWDLRDDRGALLPGNVYTVEVRATDSDGHVVRRVTPLLITR